MEAAFRFKSHRWSTYLAPPKICDCCNSFFGRFCHYIIFLACDPLWVPYECDLLSIQSALMKMRTWEAAFTSTCLPLFPFLLPFKKWCLKTKEMNIQGCVWFFFYLFSCLIKIVLTNSRKVNVAFNYLQKNLNYQFILPNVNCISLKIQWPISQHWPALLKTCHHPL